MRNLSSLTSWTGHAKPPGLSARLALSLTYQGPLAHALPTSYVEDPDLAFIVGVWDRLADECKRRLVEMAQGNLPTEGVGVKSVLCVKSNLPTRGVADEFNERGQ